LYKITIMTITQAFDGVAEMLAQLDPSKVIQLHASSDMSKRVEDLIYMKKSGTINIEETLELERYLALNMLISMAKARAQCILAA
jgi:uncharacterized protein (DUF2235 family)